MHVWMCTTCMPGAMADRRGDWLSWNWTYDKWVQATKWVPRTKFRSSAGAASAFNHGVISPVTPTLLKSTFYNCKNSLLFLDCSNYKVNLLSWGDGLSVAQA